MIFWLINTEQVKLPERFRWEQLENLGRLFASSGVDCVEVSGGLH